MNPPVLNILLADDDRDDCVLFRDALEELSLPVQLSTVKDGEELMSHLTMHNDMLPDMLFLDLNMPRKNGFECLSEIKRTNTLSKLPVIIFSTSFDPDVVEMLGKKGARHYIRKPNEFEKLKTAISQAVNSVTGSQGTGENFVLQS